MENLSLNPILNTLQGHIESRIPCWLMRQAGRHLPEYREVRARQKDFVSFLYNVKDVVEVTLQPLKRYNLDAAIIFSDILILPIMLGYKVEILDKIGPRVETIKNPSEIDRLESQVDMTQCESVYEAIAGVRSQLDRTKSLIGFAGGPWTVATYMIEGKTSKAFSDTKTFGYHWAQQFQKLLDILADYTAEHLIQQIRAGADAVKIFDSWAGSVPYNKFEDWVIKPHLRILDKLKNAFPEVPVISFPKGISLGHYQHYLDVVKVDCISFGPELAPEIVADELQDRVVVQGGLDPAILVQGGDLMVKEAHKYLEALQDGPYLFNLGHGIIPETDPKNVELLIETVRKFKS